MNNLAAQERRMIKRRHLIFHLRVFDRVTGNKLGHVVDISPEGVMLVSEQEIPIGTNYELTMHLPDGDDSAKSHDFDARSMWSSNDVNPQFYDTGFKVLQASDEHLHLVHQLIDDYGFKD